LIPGCENITLPYWDITNLMPDFLQQDPFLSYTYPVDVGSGYSQGQKTVRNDPQTIQTNMKAHDSGLSVYGYIDNAMKACTWDAFNGYWAGALHDTLIAAHDTGHNACGQTISDQNVAAFDPAFWFFHANWDRLFWQWQQDVGATTLNGLVAMIQKCRDPISYELFTDKAVGTLNPFTLVAQDTVDSVGTLDVGYGPPTTPAHSRTALRGTRTVASNEQIWVDTDRVMVSVQGINRLKIPGSFNVHLLKDGQIIGTTGFFQPSEPEKCETCVRNAIAQFDFDLPLSEVKGAKLGVQIEPLHPSVVGTHISQDVIGNPTIEVHFLLRTE
jgi:tyrosinase